MRICEYCGKPLAEESHFCGACGRITAGKEIGPPRPATLPPPPGQEFSLLLEAAAAPHAEYAGFWRRLLARLIDVVVLAAGVMLLVFAVALLLALLYGDRLQEIGDEDFEAAVGAVAVGILLVGEWLYYGLMESSSWQATLGKKAIGLKVTDLEGKRISFARATGRHFAKFLSALLLNLGFLIIAITSRKQGLHDLIADCLVLRRA